MWPQCEALKTYRTYKVQIGTKNSGVLERGSIISQDLVSQNVTIDFVAELELPETGDVVKEARVYVDTTQMDLNRE